MRILYSYLICALLLSSSIALGQDLQSLPDVPVVKSSKASEPFLGVAVNIPLLKLFGKKKPKALPEQPKGNLATLTDSSEANYDYAEIGTVNPSKAQRPKSGVDLRPLTPKETGQLPALSDLNVFSTDGTEQAVECYDYWKVTTNDDGEVQYQWISRICYGSASTPSYDGGSGGSGGNPNPNELPHVNTCEIAYLAEMAFAGRDAAYAGLSMYLNESDVYDRIDAEFPGFTDSDTEPLNAVKHAMFIAFNACDFGAFDAGNLANLHEDCGGIPANRAQATTMDLFNNNVGLSIQNQVGCTNRDNLARAIFNAFRHGQLHKLNGQPTP